MDSFRTELMGRQWGIPSELLVYEGRPYYSRDMIAYSLLHGVLIRPSTPDFLLQTSALWRMYDRFPFKDATLYPYWNNADRITCAPAGVYATAYERKKDGLLLFVSNLGDSDADATVTLNFKAFGWSDVLAWDALTDQPLDATGGVLRLPLAKDGSPVGIAGRKPSDTYPWFLNVCRQRARANGSELSAFSPTGQPGFHVPAKFARLVSPPQ